MLGLTETSGASASVLLNVEGVLTALIAGWVCKENAMVAPYYLDNIVHQDYLRTRPQAR
jgi:hypothetical protein